MTDASSLITTEYAGNFVYENSVLQFFNTAEGYVEPNGTGWQYVFQYKDHLGNIRLSYSDSNGDGVISPSSGGGQGEAEIREENNYYPFGLKHKGYNHQINGKDHKYGFGNKEEQDELGLGWIDITARNYDPALGRWMNLDPAADVLESSSQYVYALNNPVIYIDLDGELPILINGRVQSNDERANRKYWTAQILNTISNSGIANPHTSQDDEFHFVDGDRFAVDVAGDPIIRQEVVLEGSYLGGNIPSSRTRAGYLDGLKDFENVLSKLAKDPNSGKIIEKIQIYTHSRGAAYAIGYTQALLEMIQRNSNLFQDSNNVIDFILNLAPHQSKALDSTDGADAYSVDHDGDIFSGNDISGLKGAFTSDEKVKGTFGSHKIASFNKDIKAFTSAFLKGGTSQDVINNFVKTMKNKYNITVTVKQ